MPDVTVVYWRDIPAQVIVGKGRRGAKRQLPERFAEIAQSGLDVLQFALSHGPRPQAASPVELPVAITGSSIKRKIWTANDRNRRANRSMKRCRNTG